MAKPERDCQNERGETPVEASTCGKESGKGTVDLERECVPRESSSPSSQLDGVDMRAREQQRLSRREMRITGVVGSLLADAKGSRQK